MNNNVSSSFSLSPSMLLQLTLLSVLLQLTLLSMLLQLTPLTRRVVSPHLTLNARSTFLHCITHTRSDSLCCPVTCTHAHTAPIPTQLPCPYLPVCSCFSARAFSRHDVTSCAASHAGRNNSVMLHYFLCLIYLDLKLDPFTFDAHVLCGGYFSVQSHMPH